MPQASDELREQMRKRFGSMDTQGPEEFLKARGYVLSKEWVWKKDGIKGYGQIPRDEFDCMLFLVHEWDYGGMQFD